MGNLALDTIALAQDQKYQTSNDADAQLENAMTATLTVDVDVTNAATVPVADLQRAKIIQVDPDGGSAPTSAITLTLTAFQRGAFTVYNNTAYNVTVTITGQPLAAPVVPPGQAFILTMDNTNVQPVGTPILEQDIYMWGQVATPAATLVEAAVITRNMTLPAGGGNSQGYAGTVDAGAQVWNIQKNGAGIGTMNFAAATAVATFTIAAPVQFVPGDRLELVSPAAPGTQANVSFTAAMLLY